MMPPTACSTGKGKRDNAVSDVRRASAFAGKDLLDAGEPSVFVSIVTFLAFG